MSPTSLTTINQIQANLTTYFRLFAGLPGITFVDEDVTWINTAEGAPGNHILQARLARESADQRIDELIGQIAHHTQQVDWYVFPTCQPVDLGERVAARGLAGGPDGTWQLVGKIGGPGGNWMVADLTDLPSAPRLADSLTGRFHIEFVDSDPMLEVWRQVSADGFGGGDLQNFYAAYARHGYGAEACSLHYIGYVEEQPVTSGTLLLDAGIAGLFDISTPEIQRRQGFGSIITWAMMKEAHRQGYQQAYVWSSNLGKGVYAGVGFVPAEIGMREYQWQKR